MKVYTILRNIAKKVSLDYVHPVGEIFISTDSTFDPNKTWGGSWVKLTDKFLVGAGNDYTLGDVGGEATHTLTVAELPQHSHPVNIYTGSGSNGGGQSSYGSSNRGGSQYSAYGDTSTQFNRPFNILPPYQAVFMWQRTT